MKTSLIPRPCISGFPGCELHIHEVPEENQIWREGLGMGLSHGLKVDSKDHVSIYGRPTQAGV